MLCILGTILCTLLLPVPSTSTTLTNFPLPPTQDPFYIPPKNYAKQEPGTILRHRTISHTVLNTRLHSAYQLLYRTTDALGGPSSSVTTIFIPSNTNFSTLLSYQIAYDEADPDCSPSYSLRPRANYTGALEELNDFAIAALKRGIPVSTSDYEGSLSASFAAGPVAAKGVLDSIRAALSSESLTGISSTSRTILFGYSGGSLATEWATEFVNSYAPELNSRIVAAAMGGLPINFTQGFLANNGQIEAGLIAAGAQGLASAYPTFAHCMEKALIPEKAAAFLAVRSTCDIFTPYAMQDMFSYFKSGVGFLSSKCWRNVVNKAGIMGRHGVPKFPVYIYKGTADEILPTIEQTDALVKHFCDSGARVKYVRYVNGTHEGTAAQGTPDALGWLFALLDGSEVRAGCNTTDVLVQ